MNDTIKTAVGAGGVIASDMVQNINPEDLSSGMGIITQIVILVSTLIALFKKKKPKTEEKSPYNK